MPTNADENALRMKEDNWRMLVELVFHSKNNSAIFIFEYYLCWGKKRNLINAYKSRIKYLRTSIYDPQLMMLNV